MSDQPEKTVVSEAELQEAINRSGKVVRELIEESKGDVERVAFVLIGALQIIHAALPKAARESLEERIRLLLAAMYKTPTYEEIDAHGGEFRIHMGRPR